MYSLFQIFDEILWLVLAIILYLGVVINLTQMLANLSKLHIHRNFRTLCHL